MTVFIIYAPTDVADNDMLYNQLSAALSSVPSHDQLTVLGDLNGVLRCATDDSGMVGSFDSGIPNDNSEYI